MHVLDLAPLDGSDPETNFETVERELAEHDERLAKLPRIVALSKADLVPPETARRRRSPTGASVSATTRARRDRSPRRRRAKASTSCATAIFKAMPKAEAARLERRAAEHDAPQAEHIVYRPADKAGFTVEQIEQGVFRVTGRGIELLLARFDVQNDEALRHVEQRLRQIGVIRDAREGGFRSRRRDRDRRRTSSSSIRADGPR